MSEQLSFGADGDLPEAPSPISREAFDAWNEAAKRFGWPLATVLGSGRPAKLRAVVKELGGVHQWKALLEKCGTSDFLCGRVTNRNGRTPFTLSLDWALKPANLLKIREGAYFTAAVREQLPTEKPKPVGVNWRARLDRYRPRGFWHKDTEGPRPEDPGPHKAPDELIALWRKRHGIMTDPRPQPRETQEQRLEAMIATYDKVGNHARADFLRAQLAQLRGEPLVTTPRPEMVQKRDVNFSAQKRGAVDVEPDYADIPEGDPEAYDSC